MVKIKLDNRHKDEKLQDLENDIIEDEGTEEEGEEEGEIENDEGDEENEADDVDESEEEDENDPDPKPAKETAKKDDDVYKEKYKASSREAMIHYERSNSFMRTVDEAAQIKEPTEEELKSFIQAQGGDWDEMSDFNKNLAKQTMMANKRFEIVNTAVQSTRQVDEWAEKVDTFVDDENTLKQYPGLRGREEDFKMFAMKKTHRAIDLNVLMKSFFYDMPKPKKRKSLFETATGGERKANKKTMSADEVANLRKTNQRLYQKLVREGKIVMDD